MRTPTLLALFIATLFTSCGGPDYDTIIRNGMVYDGSGNAPIAADVAINADTVAFIGDLSDKKAIEEIDAEGMAVSPGFINMLSWATESLIADGRSNSDIRQGVTLEVMGEGWSMGPLSDKMKELSIAEQGDFKYNIEWTTLGEYLQYLEDKGISTNVASFVGATTLRIHEIGFEDREPTSEELEKMKALAAKAMEEGALGIGSSLIYHRHFMPAPRSL